jgi:hypothetical protein
MLFRSTNAKFTHFSGDLVSNVDDSSHGVKLSGGSTGGVVEPVGDETNIALTLRSKGSAPLIVTGGPTGSVTFGGANAQVTLGSSVTVGSTGGGVALNSSAVTYGSASTSFLAVIQRHRIDWTIGALSSAGLAAACADSTVTLTGATTNSMFLAQERVALNSTESTGIFIMKVRCSTADELRVTVANIGPSTISGSTMSAYVLQFKPA